MDLIDRDELELDTEWSDYYDGFTSYSQSQINSAVEIQAIPLGNIKQAINEVEHLEQYCAKFKDSVEIHINRTDVLSILYKVLESKG